jgi:hypothetical protein
VVLLDHTADLFFVFKGTSILFSIVVVLAYISTVDENLDRFHNWDVGNSATINMDAQVFLLSGDLTFFQAYAKIQWYSRIICKFYF